MADIGYNATSHNLGEYRIKKYKPSRRFGPWHSVSGSEQLELSERLALHPSKQLCRKCSQSDNIIGAGHTEKLLLLRPRSGQSLTTEGRTDSTGRLNMSENSNEEQQTDHTRSATSASKYLNSTKGDRQFLRPRVVKSSQSQVVRGRTVNSKELDSIVSRLVRPTVASRGGIDLLDKDFVYITPRPRKTMPEVPGLERRYLGLQSVSQQEMKAIVARLTRMTAAYTAKFGPDPNTWVDTSPRRDKFSQKT